MTNSKNTKRALFTSVVAILLCCTMLLGTTFAWFTDTATSSNNRIQAGTLDIDLLVYDENSSATDKFVSVADSTEPIFDYALWEPGYTQVETMKIVNNGTLALKYQMNVVADNIVKGANGENLADVIDVYMTFGKSTATSTANITAAKNAGTNGANGWWYCGTLTEMMANPNGFTQGVLLPEDKVNTTENGTQLVENGVAYGAVQYATASVALHMQETAGNEYQGLSMGAVDINLLATQYTSESDSFNNQYDADASFNKFTASEPVVENGATVVEVYDTYTVNEKIVVVTVPEDAVADGAEEIVVTVVEEDTVYSDITVENDKDAQTFDIDVTGLKNSNETPVKVELFVGKGLTNVKLYHYTNEIPSTNFSYNSESGYVIFETTSFSPYTVVYDATPVAEEPGDDDTTSELPKAIVTDANQYENTALTWGSYDAWTPTNKNQQLESAYTFTAPHDSTSVDACEYKDWYCDYYVSMDRDVKEDALFLGGNYGSWGWIGFENPFAVTANEEIGLLGSVTNNPWTYEMIVKNVGTFTCGVAHLDDSLDGATFTVKLCLTNPETNERYAVNTVKYTFDTTPISEE